MKNVAEKSDYFCLKTLNTKFQCIAEFGAEHSPNINFWIGLKDNFQKMSTSIPLLPFVSEMEPFEWKSVVNNWFYDFILLLKYEAHKIE